MNDDETKRPFLRIVRGTPDDEELAALTAVLAAAATRTGAAPGTADDATARRSEWAARHRLVRQPLRHAPGAWRASAFPR